MVLMNYLRAAMEPQTENRLGDMGRGKERAGQMAGVA